MGFSNVTTGIKGGVDFWPSQGYLDMILEGYREHDIPEDQIWTALDRTPPLFANYYLAKSQLLLLDSVDH